jgi:hypothetical protein
MRLGKTMAAVLLVGALAIPISSCSFSSQSRSTASDSLSESPSIESSGRLLSGEFSLIQVDDGYRPKTSPAFVQTSYNFDESGSFKRLNKSRVEEGVYLISTQGELVIYIEKVNGELLTEARIDRYSIIEESSDSITLGSGPARKLVLKRH